MTKARDSQRARLYKAEHVLAPLSERIEDVQDIQTFVDALLSKAVIQRRYARWLGAWKVRVRDGRRCRSALGDVHGIQMPRWSRTRYIILHEVAHTLAQRKYGRLIAGHGPEYAGVYLDLVKFGMGAEAYDLLKAAFKANKVRAKVDRKTRFKAQIRKVYVAASVAVKPTVKPKPIRRSIHSQDAIAYPKLRKLALALGADYKVDRSDSYFEMTACPQFPKGFTTYHYGWFESLRRLELCIADPSQMDEDGSGYSE